MNITDFEKSEINGCQCYTKGDFLIIKQNDSDIWNAYKNGSSVQKIVIDQSEDANGDLIDVLGAKEYTTPEDAAEDCI